MVSLRHIGLLLLATLLLCLMSLTVSSSPQDVLAQGTPLPTPTDIGTGGGGGDDDGGASAPGPPAANVWGYVYDYSSGARQPGITVVIEGGGWQAETVSDSNGYYRFDNLGAGDGKLSLQLPPDAHQAAANWPVSFGSGAEVRVDLGYYWGDSPPMPVLLSGSLQEGKLAVQVENRSKDVATGSLVDIRLPVGLKALPAIEVSQGTVDYSELRARVSTTEIGASSKMTIRVPLQRSAKITLNERGGRLAAPWPDIQSTDKILVMFTYDQQITPQLIALDPGDISDLEPPPSSQAAPQASAQDATPVPLPVTGTGSSEGIRLMLPILLLTGLAVAGWRSLRIPHHR